MAFNIKFIDIDGYQLSILALDSYFQVYKYDFMEDSTLRLRPKWADLYFASKNIIWLNNDLGEIGFAGRTACRVLQLNEINHLEIENILPAKGPGSTELIAFLNTKNELNVKKEIYFERGATFDNKEVEFIKTFTNLKIIIKTGAYDC